MREVEKIVERGRRESQEIRRSVFMPQRVQHDFAVHDQSRKNHEEVILLQARRLQLEIVLLIERLKELVPIQHLPVGKLLEKLTHLQRIGRFLNGNRASVQQLQRLQDNKALLRAAAGKNTQGILDRSLVGLLADEVLEDRILGRKLGEVLLQQIAGTRQNVLAEVERLIAFESRQVTEIDPRKPGRRLLLLSLVDDLKAREAGLEKPLDQLLLRLKTFALVGLAKLTVGRGLLKGEGRRKVFDRSLYLFRHGRQLEEDLVCLLLVLETDGVERAEEVEVVITRRLGRRTLVGRTEEEVAAPRCLVGEPLQVIKLPDPRVRELRRDILDFHRNLQGLEVRPIEFPLRKHPGTHLDVLFHVDGLLDVDVILLVLAVARNVLTRDGGLQPINGRLDILLQHQGLVPTQLLNERIIDAQHITHIRCREANRIVDRRSCETVNREGLDHTLSEVAIELRQACDLGLQNLCAIGDKLDVLDGLKLGRGLDLRPIRIERNHARIVLRHVLVHQFADALRERLQHFAPFRTGDAFKDFNVVRMDRIHPAIVVHLRRHRFIARRELLQMLSHRLLLRGGLAKKALSHHELHIAPLNGQRLEALSHAIQALRNEAEAWACEDHFLNAANEAEAGILCKLTDLTHQAKRTDQFPLFQLTQIIEHLVNNHQESLVWELGLKLNHHFLKPALVVRKPGFIGNLIVDSGFLQEVLQGIDKDRAERGVHAADLKTDDLELTGNRFRFFPNGLVAQAGNEACIRRNRSDDAHQVGLTGSVIADNQHSQMVDRIIPAEHGKHNPVEPLRHHLGNDVRLDEFLGLFAVRRILKLDHGGNRFKLDEFAVLHLISLKFKRGISFSGKVDNAYLRIDRIGAIGRILGLSKSETLLLCLPLSWPIHIKLSTFCKRLQRRQHIELHAGVKENFQIIKATRPRRCFFAQQLQGFLRSA